MMNEAENPGSIYVYAVIIHRGASRFAIGHRGASRFAEDPIAYGAIGLDGAPVYALTLDDEGAGALAALVSRIDRPRVRPERRNLSAHHAVLQRALAEKGVLPMTFGLIAESEQAARELLRRNHATLREQLDRVAGHSEMGLRVQWSVPNVFEYFVNLRGELRAARDALGDKSRADRGALLALGQRFERALQDERARHTSRVEEALQKQDLQVLRGPLRAEHEVMNLACLVPRARPDLFERAVNEVAADFDDHFAFAINGPWAPHSFVTLNLSAADPPPSR